MKRLIIALSVLISGCAPYAKGGIYHDVGGYVGDVGHLELGLEKRLSPRTIGHCSYIHSSNPSRGRPFNDKLELYTAELVGCGIKIGGVR